MTSGVENSARAMVGRAAGMPRRFRIAVDGRVMQDRYHGIGRHAFELVRCLAERAVNILVVHDPTMPGRLDVHALAQFPSVRLVELAAPVVSPAAQLLWPGLLRAASCDVLLLPYHLATPVACNRVPTVAFVHDCIFESDAAYRPAGRAFALAYRMATRTALARATAVATISQATRSELARLYGLSLPADAVVPHGVGKQFLALGRATTKPSTGSPRARFVLHVGVHRPHKNHAVLLAAFAKVARLLPDVRLVLVGQDDPRFPISVPDMIREYGIEGHVDVLPHVDDDQLLQLYRDAAAFAFPSLVEGFGLPVLEAMAAGVPVVTSDAAAAVEAGGGAQLVVPARDTASWSDALTRVLTDQALAAEMVLRGRRIAEQNTWDRTAERTLQLLQRVAGTASRRNGS
jgi:glycosyltransferase involved in cell wall biosynthesis